MAIAYRMTVKLDKAGVDKAARDLVYKEVVTVTRRVFNRANVLTPVRFGNLRAHNQMRTTRQSVTGEVFNDAVYACILGPDTQVVTDKGPRRIADIRPGDRVLTQSGDFREVVAATKFPVSEKPHLITITTPWRADRNHTLTVTVDHKILVRRDGVNRWVPAGEITYDDELYIRAKVPVNKGVSTLQATPCDHCKVNPVVQERGRRRRFCSNECRDEYWRANGHWMKGKDRGAEFSARQSAIRRRYYAAHPDKHPNRLQTRRSKIEAAFAEWLDMRGIEYESQKLVDGLWLDFYVPAQNRIYEIDGARWHQDFAKDVARDRRIQAAMPGVEVVHLHHYHQRFSPVDMVLNPLPDVYYVRVNPGPKSFVEPSAFRAVKPLKLEPWTWQPQAPRKGRSNWPGLTPKLYDLSVEGEHSFVASGILVSNSAVHDGSKAYTVVPVKRKALRFVVGGRVVFAKRVVIPPRRGRPFLYRALQEIAAQTGYTISKP